MISLADVFEVQPQKQVRKKKKRVKKKNIIPLVDKYRPKTLDDVVYQTDVVRMLKKTLETGDLPHMLFYGPPGTGKTSTILAFVQELFGPKTARDRVIELNASDERGIAIVRDKIVRFARSAISVPDPDYPCPPYKIIILDEADAMTNEAQSALRKIMEDHSRITRFFLSCNYINQIIDPIISRCSKFRFRPLENEMIVDKLAYITKAEEIPIKTKDLPHLVRVSSGDMRKAIMMLQNLKYVAMKNEGISEKDIYETANWVSDIDMDEILEQIMKLSQNGMDLIKLSKKIYRQAYPVQNLHRQILERIVSDDRFTDLMKGLIGLHVAETEKMLLDGANEYLQILSTVSMIRNVYHKKISTLALKL